MNGDLDAILNDVGPRLRRLRKQNSQTLASIAEATGISVSTLSRLESGARRPSLELLLPIARAHGVSLDELIDTGATADPRIRPRPVVRGGQTVVPLTRRPGGMQAYKQLMPGTRGRTRPDPRSHEGYEWLYVLDGELRLILGEHDLVLRSGEAAEFDTRVPHWFGSAGPEPVEFLSLFGPQGERIHLRARSRRASD